jgi:hypothetical protein
MRAMSWCFVVAIVLELGFRRGQPEPGELLRPQGTGIRCNYNAHLVYFLMKDLNVRDHCHTGREFCV